LRFEEEREKRIERKREKMREKGGAID